MGAPAQRHPVEKRGPEVWLKALFALRYVASSESRLSSGRQISLVIKQRVTPLKNGAQRFGSKRYLHFATLLVLGPDFRREDR
jgi:hypothetical protein